MVNDAVAARLDASILKPPINLDQGAVLERPLVNRTSGFCGADHPARRSIGLTEPLRFARATTIVRNGLVHALAQQVRSNCITSVLFVHIRPRRGMRPPHLRIGCRSRS